MPNLTKILTTTVTMIEVLMRMMVTVMMWMLQVMVTSKVLVQMGLQQVEPERRQ